MFAARAASAKSAEPAAVGRDPARPADRPPVRRVRRTPKVRGGWTDLSGVPPFTIQRAPLGDRDDTDLTGPVDPHVAAQIQSARGGGKGLPAPTRSQMEGVFGHDFSSVRVHDDARAHRLNETLNARAFTVGADVFLGSNASVADAPLMRHELTHVVQQRGTPAAGALTLGAPDTVHERAAAATAAAPAATAAAEHTVAGGATIQRFEQGEFGHGGIEKRGLAKAEFKGEMGEGEIGQIYFGNWLRDWSQVSPGSTSPATNFLVGKLLNILSWGEFNRPLDPAQLGGYLPSEHMDNPLGGKTVEAAGATHAAGDVSTQDFDKSYGTLSARQKADFATEMSPDAQEAVKTASQTSGLPAYIERSKAHIRAKLSEAVGQGRTSDGRISFGDALHGIEDYYAHSNFTELALALLARDKNAKAGNVLTAAKHEGFDATSADAVGADPLKRGAAVVTGTVGDESHNANQKVSLIEALQAEILTGSLRRAFIVGLVRTGATGLLGGALKVVGGIVGGVVGAVTGFARDVGAAIGGLFGRKNTEKFGARTKSGIASGIQTGGDVGEHVGDAIEGVTAGLAIGTVLATLITPVLLILKATAYRPSSAAKLTRESAVGAPGGKPTHSQISKDAPEHPVHQAAAALAEHADEVFGKTMIAAWSNPDKQAATASVVSLVDQFVAYPTENRDVWQKTLEDVLAAGDRKGGGKAK